MEADLDKFFQKIIDNASLQTKNYLRLDKLGNFPPSKGQILLLKAVSETRRKEKD